MQGIKEKYNKDVLPELKKKFGFKNDLAIPKIVKVVVGTGIGRVTDKAKREMVEKSMISLTGQKPQTNFAKKSIAAFKLREGMPVGFTVTLRGERMYNFLEKLINSTIPRIRDFRGISTDLVDNNGSMTIGFKEHIVFPETSREDVRQSFGLGVTIVTNAKSKEQGVELFKLIGIPFKGDKEIK